MSVAVSKDFDEGKIQRDERGRFAAFAAAQHEADQAMGRATAARNAAQLATGPEQKATALKVAAKENREASAKLKVAAKAAKAVKLAPVAAMHAKLARQADKTAAKLDQDAQRATAAHALDRAVSAQRAAYEMGEPRPDASGRSTIPGTPEAVQRHEALGRAHGEVSAAFRQAAEAHRAAGDAKAAKLADAEADEHDDLVTFYGRERERNDAAVQAAAAHASAAERAADASADAHEANYSNRDPHEKHMAHEAAMTAHAQAREAAQRASTALAEVGAREASRQMARHAVEHGTAMAQHAGQGATHAAAAADAAASRAQNEPAGEARSRALAAASGRYTTAAMAHAAAAVAAGHAGLRGAAETYAGRAAQAERTASDLRARSEGEEDRARAEATAATAERLGRAEQEADRRREERAEEDRAREAQRAPAPKGQPADEPREIAGPKTLGRPGGETVALHDAAAMRRAGVELVGPGFSEDMLSAMKRVFPTGVPTLNDLHEAFSSHAAYTKITRVSASFGGSVKVSGRVYDKDGNPLATLKRTFSNHDGRLEVHHDLFEFDREEDEGTGIGRTLLRQMIPAYQKWGAKEIHLDAAWRGRYVWARMGFDYREGNQSSDRRRIQESLADFLTSRGIDEDKATAIARAASNSLNEVARLKVPGVEETKVVGEGDRRKEIQMGAGHIYLSAKDGPTAHMYEARLPIDDPEHPQYKIAKEYLGLPR